MGIPESQLDTWANQGATATAKATHEAIRRALSESSGPLAGKSIEVYLQGSYRNSTNIYGESDVDVVVQLNSTFHHSLAALSLGEQQRFQATYPDATYSWDAFRTDVLTTLRAYFGAGAVTEGNNSLKLARGPGRLAADIVACLQYREYHSFAGPTAERYVEGITFWRRDGQQVINFPKQHIANGFAKNGMERTAGWYKPVVRIFKNARSSLIADGRISAELAPSYFLECLLYNVPDQYFATSYQHTYCNVLAWLGGADLTRLVCQNELVWLFGPSDQQWSIANAWSLLDALQRLWMER